MLEQVSRTIEQFADEKHQGIDTGCLCLVMLACFHQVAADPQSLRHKLGEGGEQFSSSQILRAASYLKLKAKQVKAKLETLADLALPAIARGNDGGYFILAGVDGDKVLIQDPRWQGLGMFTREALEQVWSGELILISKRTLLSGTSAKFDLSRFMRSILN